MAAHLPVEQQKPFTWTVAMLDKKDWLTLANVPDSVQRIMTAPNIRTLALIVPKERIQEFIEARIIWLVAQRNDARTITVFQKKFIAESILERFPLESLADFSLCFKRLAQGYYGLTYQQLDASVIIAAIEKHIEEKAMFLERDQTTSKEQAKKDETGPDYAAFKARLEEERIKEEQEKEKAREQRILELQGYKDTLSPEQLENHELKKRWMFDVTDPTSTAKTWRQKPGTPSFNEWKQNQKSGA